MALRWFENFDSLTDTTQLNANYSSTNSSLTTGVNPVDDPQSGNVLGTGNFGEFIIDGVNPTLLPASTTYFIQGYFSFNDETDRDILWFREGSTTHLIIERTTAGEIRVERNGVILATSAIGQYTTDTWMYLEIKAVIDDTVGECVIKKDSATIINLTGADTRNGGTVGTIDEINLRSRLRADELIVFDAVDSPTGTPFSDFIGQRRVVSMNVSGAGTSADFTGVGSVNNFENVDETLLDDTDYNESNTGGDKDLFTAEDLPVAPNSIDLVAVRVWAGKDNSNPRTITPVIRSGGTDYPNDNDNILTTTNSYHWQAWEDDPNTATSWTESGVNALEIGYENTL